MREGDPLDLHQKLGAADVGHGVDGGKLTEPGFTHGPGSGVVLPILDVDTNQGQAVDYRQGLSEQAVLNLLAQDLERFEAAVNDAVQVSLDQNQFDALVSFAFNVGVQAFKSSTLLKKLNQGLYHEVPAQLRRWNKTRVDGKLQELPGLTNRREKEITLWQS